MKGGGILKIDIAKKVTVKKVISKKFKGGVNEKG